jgi:hypothetical protein
MAPISEGVTAKDGAVKAKMMTIDRKSVTPPRIELHFTVTIYFSPL